MAANAVTLTKAPSVYRVHCVSAIQGLCCAAALQMNGARPHRRCMMTGSTRPSQSIPLASASVAFRAASGCSTVGDGVCEPWLQSLPSNEYSAVGR